MKANPEPSGLHLMASGGRPVMPPGAKIASMLRGLVAELVCAKADVDRRNTNVTLNHRLTSCLPYNKVSELKSLHREGFRMISISRQPSPVRLSIHSERTSTLGDDTVMFVIVVQILLSGVLTTLRLLF